MGICTRCWLSLLPGAELFILHIASLDLYRIGAEYSCGLAAASDCSEDPGIQKNRQHHWVALAVGGFSPGGMAPLLTMDIMIDTGFVLGAFVPLVLLWM
jgi:hypothetical protein